MSLEKLPYEVVNIILKNIERKHYYGHLFVSKRWHALVKPIYYKELNITSHIFEWLLLQLPIRKSSLISLEILSLVTKLTVFDSITKKPNHCPTEYRIEEYLLLLSCFTNLKTLDVNKSIYNDTCVYVLKMCDLEKFPQLEEIKTKQLGMKHLPLYLKFQGTLKRMHFYFGATPSINRDFLINIMTSFNNLRELIISDSNARRFTLFDILKACPNLYFVSYATGCLKPLYPEHTSLNDVEETTLPNPYRNLKSMDLYIPSLNTPYINFFNTHFHPENLDQLRIKIKLSFYDWIKDATLEKILKFVSRLSKIKWLYIRFEEVKDVRREDLPPEYPTKLDIFYQILSLLKGYRNPNLCVAYYDTFDSFDIHCHTVINIQNNAKLIYYQYLLNSTDLDLDPEDSDDSDNESILAENLTEDEYYNNIKEPKSYEMCPVPTPSESWAAGPQIINELKFMTRARGEFTELPSMCLDYALANCTQLKTFSVVYNNTGGTFLFAKQDRRKKSVLTDMTFVSVYNIKHSRLIVNSLFRYFPKVKSLTYYANICGRSNNVVFNLTRFKHLNTFSIDIDTVYFHGDENIFVNVHVLGKDDITYLEIWRETKDNGKFTYCVRPMETAVNADSTAILDRVIHIKCPPQLEKLKLGKNIPLFNLAHHLQNYLEPYVSPTGSNIEHAIDLTI